MDVCSFQNDNITFENSKNGNDPFLGTIMHRSKHCFVQAVVDNLTLTLLIIQIRLVVPMSDSHESMHVAKPTQLDRAGKSGPFSPNTR